MEPIPARLMRPQAEACRSRPPLTERQRQRRTYILDAARAIFLTHGRTRVQLRDVAVATGVTQIAIRNLFADLDHLFALTLHKYLDEILAAVSAVPNDRPDVHRRRRAEYFRATRGICDVPTPIHFLWMRDRFTLPEDQLETIDIARRAIGVLIAGPAWETALMLLDSPHLGLAEIEAMLAAYTEAPAQASAPAETAAAPAAQPGAQPAAPPGAKPKPAQPLWLAHPAPTASGPEPVPPDRPLPLRRRLN